MPRKNKYPNNEESPIHDTEQDPFDDGNVSVGDIEKIVEKTEEEEKSSTPLTKETKSEIDRILEKDPGACVCAARRNPKCRIHMWSDRNK